MKTLSLFTKLFIVCALILLPCYNIVFAETNEPAIINVKKGKTNDEGTFFTLNALDNCTIYLNDVEGLNNDGSLKLSKEIIKRNMTKGKSFTVQIMLTENLPNACVTAEKDNVKKMWCPQISGKDGSLILAPGFKRSK